MHVTGTKREKVKTGLLCWPSLIVKKDRATSFDQSNNRKPITKLIPFDIISHPICVSLLYVYRYFPQRGKIGVLFKFDHYQFKKNYET